MVVHRAILSLVQRRAITKATEQVQPITEALAVEVLHEVIVHLHPHPHRAGVATAVLHQGVAAVAATVVEVAAEAIAVVRHQVQEVQEALVHQAVAPEVRVAEADDKILVPTYSDYKRQKYLP